ncbi:sigma factor-like helix-turn-helix DNA-binding protein [Sphingomonas sp. Ant20]|uniref:sigma factor-like helix-turn-helix DNA-binding protein n=1 Tax=Sphingomonas sp. Ant20 TaxID=104605 RepID=UPI00325FD885
MTWCRIALSARSGAGGNDAGRRFAPGSMQSCIICWSIISGSMSGEVRRFRSTSWTTLRSVARPIRTQACTTETCCAHLMRCPRSSGRCCSSFRRGLSYGEVAAVVGVPLGTVMSRISRGRDRLATLLREGERPRLRSIR